MALRDEDVVCAVRIGLPTAKIAERAARHRGIDGLDADRSDPDARRFVGDHSPQMHGRRERCVDMERLGRERPRICHVEVRLVVVPLAEVGGRVRAEGAEEDPDRPTLRHRQAVAAIACRLDAVDEDAAGFVGVVRVDTDPADAGVGHLVGHGAVNDDRRRERGVDVRGLGGERPHVGPLKARLVNRSSNPVHLMLTQS